ncbi:unnamed protein product [Cuscuta campestris]|uniref:DUF4283 domain-containing protein n=1 Tax=Cuscuta campestris TaxID=132261 RepID=A0A484LE52_9ASTE|nr:unnamed protein product [Cuscuta campestris]
MEAFLNRLGLIGKFSLSILSTRKFLINFDAKEDYLRVLCRKTWDIHGRLMRVTKWSPGLSPEIDNPIVPVWISIPDLPIHLHDMRALKLILSHLGNPIMVDLNTKNFSRPTLARVCVKMDVSNLPVPKVLIIHGQEELIFPIFFENQPEYCKKCRKLGHNASKCGGVKVVLATLSSETRHGEGDNSVQLVNKGQREGKEHVKEDSWHIVHSKKEISKKGSHWRVKNPNVMQEHEQTSNWKGGPGESSLSAGTHSHVVMDGINLNDNPKVVFKGSTYAINDPNFLSTNTMRHLFQYTTPSPILEKVPLNEEISLVPYMGFRDDHGLSLAQHDIGGDTCMFSDGDSADSDLEEIDMQVLSPLPKGMDAILDTPFPKSTSKALKEEPQITSCLFLHVPTQKQIWISSVYGKHTRANRLDLWESLRAHKTSVTAWLVGGDFNAITSYEKHKGKSTLCHMSMDDFIEALDFCELSSPQVSGGAFTWFGNRSRGRVFKRLDRVLNNEKLFDLFSEVSVRHKGRGLSDHKALLVLLNNPMPSCPKPFRNVN